ncbi:MAG: endonuclease MutS2 [Acholeplasmataceae bacterium]
MNAFMTKTLEFDQILTRVSVYAKTEHTKHVILSLSPTTDIQQIETMLSETESMVHIINRLSPLPLIEDYDISGLLKTLSVQQYLGLNELMVVKLFLSMEKDVFNYLNELKKLNIPLNQLGVYRDQLTSHHLLLGKMQDIIDDHGQIVDRASDELYRIRKAVIKLDKQLQEKLQKMLSDYGSYLNEPMIVLRNERFCIPVKEAFKNKVKGVIHDVSASKQTIYIEPEQTRQITQDIETLKALEKNEIERIIRTLCLDIILEIETISKNLNIFFILDTITAKARYARDINAIKPLVNQEQTIDLKHARHPLLDPKEVVPISLALDEHQKTILITGPNTGGKTVALKTLGLLTIMMQSGLLIPAAEASTLSIFNAVYADIGDEQSIMQSLSTFSSHMKKIINMLEHLDDKMLVLLDEIGSGTDPNEGVCLAISMLDAFMEKDIRMMVTTHYSELKMYAYEKRFVTTASVAFDKNTLKPLYYLQMKTTGSSHAFLIAQKLGLPKTILDQAQTLYAGRQSDLAKIMEKLNEEMLALEEQKEALVQEIESAHQLQKHYRALKEKLATEQTSIIEQTKKREEAKWQDLKEQAQDILNELSSKKVLTQPEYASIKNQLNKQPSHHQDYTASDEAFKVGDEVFITSYQQIGNIVALKENQARVVFGQFDLWFDLKILKKDFSQPKEKSKTVTRKKASSTTETPQKQGKLEIDLRGYRYEEVYPALDQAIDQAILSGMRTLRIIHGFGTGAVRKAVYAYIKDAPHIESSRFGGEGEGLNGVTIITLK